MATVCAPCGAIQLQDHNDAYPASCWCCHASPVVLANDDDETEED